MWKKLNSNFDIHDLAVYDMQRNEKSPKHMITWTTSDGLIHLCSFEMFVKIKNEEVEPTTKFTIWGNS